MVAPLRHCKSGGSEGVNTSGIKERENRGGKVEQSCNRFAALLRGGTTLFPLFFLCLSLNVTKESKVNYTVYLSIFVHTP